MFQADPKLIYLLKSELKLFQDVNPPCYFQTAQTTGMSHYTPFGFIFFSLLVN